MVPDHFGGLVPWGPAGDGRAVVLPGEMASQTRLVHLVCSGGAPSGGHLGWPALDQGQGPNVAWINRKS